MLFASLFLGESYFMLLTNKVALITGAARGTGAGIAQVFAREGAAVVVNQVKEEGNPQQVVADIQAAGGERPHCGN
jgi:NAD(P)-dependent dehydrogenase (short-subunit alcohol dehydrogenase family)